MKSFSRTKILLLSTFALTISIVASQSAMAQGFFQESEKGTTVSSSKVIDSSAYIVGNDIKIAGTIKGDLFCAGNSVTIAGNIEGDVICVGSNLTVSGNVTGDVRLAGSNVTLKGKIAGNATLAASNLITENSFVLGGDMTGGASTANLAGNIGRDLLLGSSSLTLNGVVGRDVTSGLEAITFGEQASVKGNLSYQSEKHLEIADEVVAGTITHTQPEKSDMADAWKFAVLSAIAFIAFSLFTVLILPKYIHETTVTSTKNVFVAFLAGFAFVALTPFFAILAIVSSFGMYIGVALLLVWLLTMVIAFPVSVYYLGQKVLGKRAKNALIVQIAGSAIFAILCFVPGLNIVICLAALLLGSGLQVIGLSRQFGPQPYKIVD